MTLSVFARGANVNAGNASLNVLNSSQQPTTELTFSPAELDGDLVLDFADGGVDPDTLVTIDGVTTSFTVEFAGALPDANRLRDVDGTDLRGEEIVVISTPDGTEYMFTTAPDGSPAAPSFFLMDAFPNGAFSIEGLQDSGSVFICFAAETAIDTPDGPRPAGSLRPGDFVQTDAGVQQLRWVGRRTVTASELARNPGARPVRFEPHALGPSLPAEAVEVSPNHRVLLSGWKVELATGAPRALCPARHLVDGHRIRQVFGGQDVTYVHLMFQSHRIVYASGLPSESFEPGPVGLACLDADQRAEVMALFRYFPPTGGPLPFPAMRLKRHEGRVMRPGAA